MWTNVLNVDKVGVFPKLTWLMKLEVNLSAGVKWYNKCTVLLVSTRIRKQKI